MTPTDSQKSGSSILGARASNAGDVFQELWALRCALELLVPRSDLKAVTVEGIAAPASAGYQYDGVDCGLFFGAPTIDRATRIELLQLKYSTADPDKAWTAARLTANSASKGDNSVIRKLADTFVHAKTAALPTAEIVIRFVSNQPLASEVSDAIDDLRNGAPLTAAASRLVDASGLQGEELQSFLRSLDFSQMAAGSRSALFDSLTFAVSEIMNGNADAQVLLLQARVRQLMLPGAELERITQHAVLSWFGLSSPAGLFPAPQDLTPVINPIPRQPARDLLDALHNGARMVCLHGAGGCGKTTTVMQVPAMLPQGSIAVTFDCYGAGRYTRTNDRRHLPENAFLQIINELAWEQETPFLVANSSTNPATIRTFVEKVGRAAAVLSASSPDALLIVIVDAADNSVAAAELSSPPSACFVWDLAQADLSSLPQNARIVFSTRTARKSKLRLPGGTPEILCPPFIIDETRAFARSRYPATSETWIEQFHALSNGIPRVQAYAFARGGSSAEDALEALRPSGKKLDTVLRELFQGAATKVGDTAFYSKCIAALAALPAPVPIEHLAGVCNAPADLVTDFLNDVQPTLRVEEGTVTIADEDVEDFLQQEAAPRLSETVQDVCAYFSTRFREDAYAAVHYCDFLAKASRWAEILPIVEKDLFPAGIADPVERREVQLRRLRLALGACRSTKSAIDTLKVVLLSAEAAKDEHSFQELLEKETDLAVRFASSSLVRLVLSDRDRYPKHGSILAQDAALAALNGDPVSARERLNAYGHWMDRRRDLPGDKWRKWPVEEDDIEAIIEAIAVMDGAKAGIAAMQRWKPVSLWISVGLALVPRLIARGKRQIVEDAYTKMLLPAPWSLLLTVPLTLAGYPISAKRLSDELSALRRSNVPDVRLDGGSSDDTWQLTLLETIVTAIEMGLSRGVDQEVLRRALNIVLDHRRSPSRGISRLEVSKIDIMLRAWLLRSHLDGTTDAQSKPFEEYLLNSNQPPPPKKRGRKKKPKPTGRTERDEEFKQTINAIFPIYTSRLAVLVEAATGPIAGIPKAPFTGLARDAYYFDRDHWSGEFRRRAGRSIIRLMHIPDISVSHLYQHAQIITSNKGDDAFASRTLAVWEQLLLRPDMHQSIVDGIASRVERLRDLRTGARSKADALVKFCRLLVNFSEDDARAIFERTIEIVQEIDREAIVQIDFVSGLAERQRALPSAGTHDLAVRFASFVTDVAIRLEGEEYFPWKNATKALHALSPGVALAAVSQWQDEGIASFSETLPSFLKAQLSPPASDVLLACSLLILLPRPSLELFRDLAGAAAAIDSENGAKAFESLALHCLMHILPESRVEIGKAILEAHPRKWPAGPNMQRLRGTISFSKVAEKTVRVRAVRGGVDVDFPADADFSTREGIAAAIQAAREQSREKYIAFSSILAAARTRIVQPSQRVPFLNAVATFNGDSLLADERAEAILDALRDWQGGPAIENWRTNDLPRILSANLWALSRWLHERQQGLPRLLETSGLSATQQINAIASGLEDGREGFSSSALFELSQLMAPGLSMDELRELTEWYIARLYAMVPSDVRERYDGTDIPIALDGAVARFIFALMSDIDVRVRWRAAHCVRQLSLHRGPQPLSSLAAVYARTTENSFRLPTAPYYWMAARLWTVMTAARIAADTPAAVLPIAKDLAAIVLDKGFPHYLIRLYAKQALDALASHGVLHLGTVEKRRLASALEPSKPAVEVKRHPRRELERPDRKERRFKFDSMDTVPYWYSPMHSLFATLTTERFFRTLEKWLIDRWKVDPEANWWDKEPRKARLSEREHMRTSHRHGSQPTVERYGSYLEWHAMFCGLGEWIKTEALAIPEWESDRFSYYLARWLPTEPPTWLADRRAFAPLESNFVFDEGGDDKHWLRRIPKSAYLATLSPDEDPALLIVGGRWTICRSTRESIVEVSSALVSPETATSLMKTMEHAEQYRFHLPYDRPEDRDDIDAGAFVLRSWLAHVERDSRFDGSDPLRNEVAGIAVQPAGWMTKKFGLKRGGTPPSEWSSPNGPAFSYKAWSDFDTSEGDSYNRQRTVGTYGHRLQLDRRALQTILASEKLDLIVKVEYERRLEKEYGRSSSWNDKEKRRETHKYFVFRQDGSIEDASGRAGSWSRAA